MMKLLLGGTFEQVEQLIHEDFATRIYTTQQKFSVGFALMTMIFIIGGLYILFGASSYMVNHISEATVPLDENNEFITILGDVIYLHIVSIIMFIGLIWTLATKNKHHIKSAMIYHSSLLFGYITFTVYFFRLSELLVSSFFLRMVYLLVFLAIYLFVAYKSFRYVQEIASHTKKPKSKLQKWIDDMNKKLSGKKVIGFLLALLIIYQIFKRTGPGKEFQNFQMEVIGSLVDFFPLLICLLPFFCIYLFKSFVKMYYLNKYSEQFRVKYRVNKQDWYGRKSS